MPDVLKHLRAADALAGRVGDVRRQGWAACYLCQYFWAVGDHEQALQSGDHALAIARELGDLALAAVSGYYRGIALVALGRFPDAERALSLSLEEVDAARTSGEHRFPSRRFGQNWPAIVGGFLSATLGELGRFADGHRHGNGALRLADATDSPFGLVAATTGLASLHLQKMEPGNAIPLLERALALCRTHRLYNWLSNAAASLGRAYLDAGRIDEGVVLLEESARPVERTGIVVNRSRWLAYLGEGYLAVGQVTRAQDVAERALELAWSCKERGNAAWALLLLGGVLARTGPAPSGDALSLTCQALSLAEELGQRPLEVRCHRALGALLAPRNPAAAARHETRAAEIAAEIGLAPPPAAL
jgi:tetratricopeptide (TPR) repeat protein